MKYIGKTNGDPNPFLKQDINKIFTIKGYEYGRD